tara:strand:- start:241 stop:720 length:480 start_codon:yes stop_codon:yes gene_type:complete
MYRKDCNYLGCDFCREFLEISRTKYKQNSFLQINVKSIPIRNNVFDSVISIAVIHHIYFEVDRINAIRELVRVTKPGGTIFISVWGVHGKYKKGNNFIKWTLQDKYSEQKDKNVYERFYYLYDENELYNLVVREFKNIEVIDYFSNYNNRFILIKKINS